MAKPAPLPDLTLNDQELMGTYSEFMPIVMDMLQSFHPEKPITGDDLYSFFGLCVGALIDNDSHLATPRDIRLGAETSAVHAIGWAKRFREMRGDDGPSFLAYVHGGDRQGDPDARPRAGPRTRPLKRRPSSNWQGAIDDAWEHLDVGDHAAAITLVRQVLIEQPDAIDAYVVLAQTCSVPAEEIALLAQAVRIGDRTSKPRDDGTIDPEGIYDPGAHVRALNNLARSLWADGRPHQRADALRNARRALRMDSYDRAGTRLQLMAWEAASENWPAARRLTLRYRREPRTEVRYWLALHAFRDGSNDADALLATAVATNPHVVPALQGRLRALHIANRSYAFGSPEEATHYSDDARDGWKATRGALAWLAKAQH